MHSEIIKNLGEKELIRRISMYMPKAQTSDDCAFVKNNKKNLLINTDLMIENTHFTDETISALDLGWKAITSNISDLISSGCDEIIGVKIGLVLSKNTEWIWVKNLYEGMNQALSKFGGSIIGGDCSKGSEKTIAITAFGTQGHLKLRRYSSKPKEVILTTGIHGLSRLGLDLKENKIQDKSLLRQTKLIQDSIKAFSRPEPKPNILKQLIKSRSKNQKLKVGCTDSSDGLYQAILDLAIESGCKAVIDYTKIPKHESWPKGKKWDEIYFFGGEDYELIFSLPRTWANKLMDIEKSVIEIGYFKKGEPSIEFSQYDENNLSINNIFSHF
ncbi:MAG: thiamine-phosphate kinase [Prochlorococcus sp. SP3034]|nr:thiamine-phosphate kinase [Prochlorococcus sp. SP3034]